MFNHRSLGGKEVIKPPYAEMLHLAAEHLFEGHAPSMGAKDI